MVRLRTSICSDPGDLHLSGLEIPNLATILYGYPKNLVMCDTKCCDINVVIDW